MMDIVDIDGEKYVKLSDVTNHLEQADLAVQNNQQLMLRELAKFTGPDGFSDWRDAAVAERLLRVQLQRQLSGEFRCEEWNRVEAGLPAAHELVLVAGSFSNSMRVAIGAITDGGDWWLKGCSWSPEFWMALPTLPVKGQI